MTTPPKKILFVCTGNICRSALAELLLRQKLEAGRLAGFEVKSAGVGTKPDLVCPPEMLDVLKKLGLDGTKHKSQPLSGELVDWADLILAMEGMQQMLVATRFPRSVAKVRVLKKYVQAPGDADIEDPFRQSKKVYESSAAEIRQAVEKLFEKLKGGPDGPPKEKS